jgi:hypothetical protein
MSDRPAAGAGAWGLAQAELHFVAGARTGVSGARTGRRLALRIQAPGYRSYAELLSELQWMAALDQAGLRCRARCRRAGRLLEAVGRTASIC